MPKVKKEPDNMPSFMPVLEKQDKNKIRGDEEAAIKPLLSSADSAQLSKGNFSMSYSTLESFLKLCDIQETALAMEPKPDFTAALKSEELKGKLYGLYSDKKGQAAENEIPRLLVEFVDMPLKEENLNKTT